MRVPQIYLLSTIVWQVEEEEEEEESYNFARDTIRYEICMWQYKGLLRMRVSFMTPNILVAIHLCRLACNLSLYLNFSLSLSLCLGQSSN